MLERPLHVGIPNHTTLYFLEYGGWCLKSESIRIIAELKGMIAHEERDEISVSHIRNPDGPCEKIK